MRLIEYIKSKFRYMVFLIIIISIVDIYLISINTFVNNLDDFVYLNFLMLIISLVFFTLDYKIIRNKYKDLHNSLEENQEIDSYLINGDSFEEELIKSVIVNMKNETDREIKEYKKSLRELDEYIAKWVHEIKIPIAALNIITDRIDNIEDSMEVKNQIAKMNFLVNSILYSSKSASMFEDIFINNINLEKLIKASVKNNSFLLIKNNIEVKMSSLSCNVYTDIKCMSYILDQIINNAIKYSKEVGKIEFSAKTIENGVILSIKDYGIGINEEDIGRIFDKGFTGSNGRSRLYKSTGMGLYFSKNIINKLGHSIEVYSKKNLYTEFKIYFYNISDHLNIY